LSRFVIYFVRIVSIMLVAEQSFLQRGLRMVDRDKEHQERLIAEAECRARSGLSRVQRWRLEREGRFPRRLRLGTRTVRWRLSEILAWIADLPAAAE
jgi:prophage regulatory protein